MQNVIRRILFHGREERKMSEHIVHIPDDMKDSDELFVGNLRRDKELIRCADCVYSKRNPRVQSIHQYVCDWHGMSVFGHYYCGTAEKRKEE